MFGINDAFAQDAATAAQQSGFANLIPILLIFGVFYFFLIRPQQKRMKEHKQLVEALDKGKQVVTAGGLIGKVVKADDDILHVEIADNVVVQVQRQTIASVVDDEKK